MSDDEKLLNEDEEFKLGEYRDVPIVTSNDIDDKVSRLYTLDMNKALLQDMDTLAANNIESMDRVVTSSPKLMPRQKLKKWWNKLRWSIKGIARRMLGYKTIIKCDKGHTFDFQAVTTFSSCLVLHDEDTFCICCPECGEYITSHIDTRKNKYVVYHRGSSPRLWEDHHGIKSIGYYFKELYKKWDWLLWEIKGGEEVYGVDRGYTISDVYVDFETTTKDNEVRDLQ